MNKFDMIDCLLRFWYLKLYTLTEAKDLKVLMLSPNQRGVR